jgi:hypothetical protein
MHAHSGKNLHRIIYVMSPNFKKLLIEKKELFPLFSVVCLQEEPVTTLKK